MWINLPQCCQVAWGRWRWQFIISTSSYLSTAIATKVKMEAETETPWTIPLILQTMLPNGHPGRKWVIEIFTISLHHCGHTHKRKFLSQNKYFLFALAGHCRGQKVIGYVNKCTTSCLGEFLMFWEAAEQAFVVLHNIEVRPADKKRVLTATGLLSACCSKYPLSLPERIT